MIKRSVRIVSGAVLLAAGVGIWAIQRLVPKCSCAEDGPNWGWPRTIEFEPFGGLRATVVICRKHGTQRLYDPANFTILSKQEDAAVRKDPSGYLDAHQAWEASKLGVNRNIHNPVWQEAQDADLAAMAVAGI